MKIQDISPNSLDLYTITISSEKQALSYIDMINKHFNKIIGPYGGFYEYSRIKEPTGKLWFRFGHDHDYGFVNSNELPTAIPVDQPLSKKAMAMRHLKNL